VRSMQHSGVASSKTRVLAGIRNAQRIPNAVTMSFIIAWSHPCRQLRTGSQYKGKRTITSVITTAPHATRPAAFILGGVPLISCCAYHVVTLLPSNGYLWSGIRILVLTITNLLGDDYPCIFQRGGPGLPVYLASKWYYFIHFTCRRLRSGLQVEVGCRDELIASALHINQYLHKIWIPIIYCESLQM